MTRQHDSSVLLSLRVWAHRKHPGDPITIKIASKHPDFISTVRDISGKRCHKHLFSKLKKVMEQEGKWPDPT
jgi:hypothetical protein